MQARSSLSEDQRAVAVALFEEGAGTHSVATQLGVSRDAVRNLHHRWLVRGRVASVTKPDRRSFSFEFKLEVVQRFFDSALSRWNSFVESILLVTGEVPKWSRTTMFGAATGADLVDDSDTVLICVESMGYQPPGRTWRPISPPCTTEWYVTWRTGLGTPQIIEALAVEFPDAEADGII